MVTLIDPKLGNIGSVANMLKRIGVEVRITSAPHDIAAADALILPGVGHFDTGMQHLQDLQLVEPLQQKVLERQTPILGICLGMQLITRKSEEGTASGLGLIDAETIQFRKDQIEASLRFPHMGWNTVIPHKHQEMFLVIEEETRFYFVHNFHVICDHQADVLTTTEYGYQFASAFQHDNIWGVQFHPEKSHRFGMHFLKTWVELC
ncbi:imidazole glycerol phosphate synthase subunit HisH [candidate division KSB3 bacterium]|uniref:Imidazole glycerol phosphate synthase subunit HisH n=1 Tax=candidate division KSB3 bacterium TaxID=2044937 RepID=A0A9D5Q4Y5_9BACT|nr:imidazole glycerol phosphate synthase subunit HisH [candidate division KSB3 bacterium]MBD3324224.1 imidazole glycerol phosphate synthase subunit HisH [candidate division KSB3 bacterium]